MASPRAHSTLWGMLLALLALIGGLALIMWAKMDVSSTASRRPPPFSGEMQQFIPAAATRPAPQTPFADGEGKTLTLDDFRGRVLVINFWATWCVPCVEEMPALDRLQAALAASDAAVLAISQDRGGIDAVAPFYAKLGLRHLAIYLDPRGTLARAFAVPGLPVTVIVDRDGREVGRLTGAAAWDSPAALALVRHYLTP